MIPVGQPERPTQDRVLALFRDELGYRTLGDWSDRPGNSNVEEVLLGGWLAGRGVPSQQAATAIHRLRTEASATGRTLYEANRAVYSLLRYGVGVKFEAGTPTETVPLVDWDRPEANDFAVAEEVTLRGGHERRPDVVLFLNGIAVGVLELKNSRVTVGDGIRQSLSNQRPEFNAGFFSTVQLVMAGNDSQGLRYGTVGTPEKLFLPWKEDEADDARSKLDKYLLKMCSKRSALIELIHDFILFDAGHKEAARAPHQYFGDQGCAAGMCGEKKGGIVWHTQGSGKSIMMVLLAKWILENNPNARVVIAY